MLKVFPTGIISENSTVVVSVLILLRFIILLAIVAVLFSLMVVFYFGSGVLFILEQTALTQYFFSCTKWSNNNVAFDFQSSCQYAVLEIQFWSVNYMVVARITYAYIFSQKTCCDDGLQSRTSIKQFWKPI